nr:MAG TPA: TMEM61 protein family [Caudoviricetes sp.]
MKRAQCQTVMDTVIYILCGVSITLAVCSIVINVRRRKRGRKQEKD